MRIAVLWGRMGPYHLARLRGALDQVRNIGGRVVAIEVASRDHYPWLVHEVSAEYERITLFPDIDYASLSAGAIRRELSAALDKLQPDALAINGWSVTEALGAMAWCRRHPETVAVLMSESKYDDSPRSWWKEAIKKRRVARFDAALVGGTRHRDYLHRLGFSESRIFRGYDVVDNQHFQQGAERARAERDSERAKLHLPPKFFLACTRLLPRKRVDVILEAFAVYRQRMGDDAWGLVIAGSGEQERELRALAREHGETGIRWAGFVQYPDLPRYYGLASAFVHAAEVEPWGLVVNEAAAAGLPLLISETVGAADELVREGVNGFRFAPGKVDALVELLVRISLLSEKQRLELGEASAHLAAEFEPVQFGRGLLAAIEAGQRRKAAA